MRVALVTNGLLYGGAERIVEALALGLDAAGDEVHVVATTRDGPIGEALRARGIPVTVLHIRSALDARVAVELASLVRRVGAEIVHSHLVVSDLAAAAAGLIARGPRLVTTVHSPYVELSRARLAVWRAALRRFDRITATSEAVRAQLPRGLDVTVLHPSLVEDAPPSSRADARGRLGLADDVPLVLGVGRLARVKGWDVLADASPALRSRGARVMVIGDGPEHGALHATGQLELLGARADAAELLAAADVVVVPSRSEGFPQVPLQAMAAGVPVVATKVGGTPEIVVPDETGLLVAPEDGAALARAILAVLDDAPLARRLGEAGRARLFTAGLTRSAMVAATRTLYASALAARAAF